MPDSTYEMCLAYLLLGRLRTRQYFGLVSCSSFLRQKMTMTLSNYPGSAKFFVFISVNSHLYRHTVISVHNFFKATIAESKHLGFIHPRLNSWSLIQILHPRLYYEKCLISTAMKVQSNFPQETTKMPWFGSGLQAGRSRLSASSQGAEYARARENCHP